MAYFGGDKPPSFEQFRIGGGVVQLGPSEPSHWEGTHERLLVGKKAGVWYEVVSELICSCGLWIYVPGQSMQRFKAILIVLKGKEKSYMGTNSLLCRDGTVLVLVGFPTTD